MTTHTKLLAPSRGVLVLALGACQSPVEGSSGGATEANTETATSTWAPDTMPPGGGSSPSSTSTAETNVTSDSTGGGSSSSGPTSTTDDTIPLSCGNGIVDPGEACDEGSNPNADQHNGDDQRCTSQCELAVCGDGLVLAASGDDPGEECDEGDDNTGEYGGCAADCTLAPRCGDGELQPEYEYCDCGEPPDPQASSCMALSEAKTEVPCAYHTCRYAAQLVFLADPEGPPGWSGSFSFAGETGIEAADRICDALAAEAGLLPDAARQQLEEPEEPRFRAWLSTPANSVKNRFTTYEDRWYVQRTGLIVAESWSDLLEDGPVSQITITQDGDVIPNAWVWSNTTMDGSALDMVFHCNNWTQDLANFRGRLGYNGDSDDLASWTADLELGSNFCNFPYRVYCFEQ